MFAQTGRWIADAFWHVGDQGIIDGTANGLGRLFRGIGGGLRRIETGYARRYALAMLVGIVIVVAALVAR